MSDILNFLKCYQRLHEDSTEEPFKLSWRGIQTISLDEADLQYFINKYTPLITVEFEKTIQDIKDERASAILLAEQTCIDKLEKQTYRYNQMFKKI